MGLLKEKCVFIHLVVTAVVGQLMSRFATVTDTSTFTNFSGHLIVTYVTVATDHHLNEVGTYYVYIHICLLALLYDKS